MFISLFFEEFLGRVFLYLVSHVPRVSPRAAYLFFPASSRSLRRIHPASQTILVPVRGSFFLVLLFRFSFQAPTFYKVNSHWRMRHRSVVSYLWRAEMADDRRSPRRLPSRFCTRFFEWLPEGWPTRLWISSCVRSCTVKRPACIASSYAYPFHPFLISSCFSSLSCLRSSCFFPVPRLSLALDLYRRDYYAAMWRLINSFVPMDSWKCIDVCYFVHTCVHFVVSSFEFSKGFLI